MQAFHYDAFTFPMPPDHRFPAGKYQQLSRYLLEHGILSPADLHAPTPASPEQLALVHTPEYIHKVLHGGLSDKEIRRIGLPWSPQLVQRLLHSVGSTLQACRVALAQGIAASLGGGTHHAYPDHGEGYCIFNDVAVAVRVLQRENIGFRAAVIDCDVHQGNGTAAIFAGEPTTFTFSIHGEKNFPFHKERSTLDIALPDKTADSAYLDALQVGLAQVLAAGPFHLAVYLAGADPHSGDRLGRMALSKPGLAQRDRLVFQRCFEAGLPVAITMSGGYGKDIQDVVEIHAETIRLAQESWQRWMSKD